MSLRTPVARARGLGSAKEGAHHWWVQRLTAVALIPLTIWFAISVIGMIAAADSGDAGYAAMVGWMRNPIAATLMIGLLVAGFYHAALGMQVVYEDYIEPKWLEVAVNVVTRLVLAFFGIASIVSVLMIAFGG